MRKVKASTVRKVIAFRTLFFWSKNGKEGNLITCKYFTYEDRKHFEEQYNAGAALPDIADTLGVHYDFQKVMYESCQKYDVPFALALAVAEKESGFNPDAESRTDDHGIMQINRCNFEYLRNKGIDPLTYEGNIEAGVMLLGENLTRYGDEGLAVMTYNCGRTGAKRLWDAGVYSTSYSRAIMELYEKWLGVLEVQQ